MKMIAVCFVLCVFAASGPRAQVRPAQADTRLVAAAGHSDRRVLGDYMENVREVHLAFQGDITRVFTFLTGVGVHIEKIGPSSGKLAL